MARLAERIAAADWIYTMCSRCDGFVYAAADIPGKQRGIAAELLRASRERRRTMRVRITEARPHGCTCPWPSDAS